MGSSVVVVDGGLQARGAVDGVLGGYRHYLLAERGLSEATVVSYERRVRLFLSQRETLDGLRLQELSAADVSGFLARECPMLGGASAQLLVAAVRSVLRYLHYAGLIAAPLEWAVPAVAVVPRSLPRGLEPATVAALLDSCARRRMVGRRDYAILLLLSRLGLRASEVSGMVLEDIIWRAGEIVVHGKGGRLDRLPLPVDIGEALTSYLKRRPVAPDGCRAVFLKGHRAGGCDVEIRGRCGGARRVRARGGPAGRLPPAASHRGERDASGGRDA